jgi:3-deoxy-7-phosphoheptulonate synthase
MAHIEGEAVRDPHQAAAALVGELPAANYVENFQPDYADEGALIAGIRELHVTTPVTTPRQVDRLSEQFASIAEGDTDTPILILGNCNEEVRASMPIDELVGQSQVMLEAVSLSAMRHAAIILRGRGQNTKPRSSPIEELPDGSTVAPYMGDAVNHRYDLDWRAADPSRMVAAAVQARDLEAGLTKAEGRHVPAAHEALLLPYERSFTQYDALTGREYLLSADLPWIGKRTNTSNGVHTDLLAGVENPVGVKIGPDSTPQHVLQLAEELNPDNQPGKLVLMFRLGLDNTHKLPPMLRAIKEEASGSILMNDIHGSTKLLHGKKVRIVSDIIRETQTVAALCQSAGLKLHGVHLETTHDEAARQCIDSPAETPEEGNLDPQLNPRQTRRVLDAVAPYMALRPAK